MASQPNILLLFTDQQRFDSIGALGNPIIRTPVIDRLCKEGTVFTRCYTPSPVCVPARAAMVTGLPPHCTCCWDNCTNIDPEVPSFMEKLTVRGYQTHGVGKMHFTPTRRRMWGFQSRDISERSDDDYRAFLDKNGFDYVLDVHGTLGEMYTIPQVSLMPAHLHESAWVADCSIDFVKRRDTGNPFFLWSSFFSPHPPFDAPTPWNFLYWAGQMPPPFRPSGCEDLLNYWNEFQNRTKYRGQGFDEMLMRTIKAYYYASISFVDYQIGRILEALGKEIDNTLIIFTSDHGELLGDYGCMGKRCMLDAAARIPLIVRWPGGEMAGLECDAPVSLLDIHPTLLAASGHPDSHVHREGQNLYKILTDENKREIVFSQFQTGKLGLYMAVTRNFKYIYSAADEREWFFDLQIDPQETHNYANNALYADELKSLRQALFDRYNYDGYSEILDRDNWRLFGKQKLASHSDEGLMVQYSARAKETLQQLGPYAPTRLPEESWPGKNNYSGQERS